MPGWPTAKRKCIVCRERPAEVPDRNALGATGRMPAKKVCGQCHAQRLRSDLDRIIKGARS